jgi:transcriptional regulator with XRE-family HTH domain
VPAKQPTTGAGSRRHNALCAAFAQQLKQLLAERDWTLARLSAESGLSLHGAKKLLAGQREPSLSTLRALAAGLGCTISDLDPP